MKKNSYLGLLDQEVIRLKDPISRKERLLYRVIALKSFQIKRWGVTIPIYSIGGYVESLDNIDDETAPCWIDNRSRVFGNAIIKDGSYISDNCIVYGDAVVSKSNLKNYVRIHGTSEVIDSELSGLSEIKGSPKIERCTISNSAMIFENPLVTDTHMDVGSCIRGNAHVIGSTLTHTSKIQGESIVYNCKLENQTVISEGEWKDQTFSQVVQMKEERGQDSEIDLINNLRQVTVNFDDIEYKGWAMLTAGMSKAFLYRDKTMKHLVNTRNGMQITVLAEELYGTEVFPHEL